MCTQDSLPHTDRFEYVRCMSANSLAEGWETTVRGNGKRCFVKIPARHSDLSAREQVKALTDSYRLQGRIRYGGVLRAVECYRQGGSCAVLYPFLDAADYQPWLPERWGTEQTACLGDAALTIDFLHTLGLVHCDLKTENFGLRRQGREWRPILIDLDFLWEVGERRPAWIAGTPGGIAPEVVGGGVLTASTDFYSFGQSLRMLIEKQDFVVEASEKKALLRLIALLTENSPERRPTSLLGALHRAELIDSTRFAALQKRLLAARLVNAFKTERFNVRRGGFDLQKKIFFASGIYSIPDDFVHDLRDAYATEPSAAVVAFKEFWRAAEVDQYGEFWQARVSDDEFHALFETLAGFRSGGAKQPSQREGETAGLTSASLREFLSLRANWTNGAFRDAGIEQQRSILEHLSDLAIRLRRSEEAIEYMQAWLPLYGPGDPQYLDIVQKLVVQLFAAGRLDEGESELNKAKQTLGEGRPAAIRALDRHTVWFLTNRGKLDEASRVLERIVAETSANDEIETLVKALGNQAALARRRGDIERTLELYDDWHRLAVRHDLLTESGHVLAGYSEFCYRVGDFPRALKLAKELDNVLATNDQPYLKRSCYTTQMLAFTRLGEYQKAEYWLGMLLNETHRQAGPYAYAVYYSNLGWLHTVRCDLPRARRCLEQAAELGRRTGLRQYEMQAYKNFAYLALMEGNGQLCDEHIENALEVATAEGDRIAAVECRALQTLDAFLYGNPPSADTLSETIRELVTDYCLSYAGLFYLQTLAANEDEVARTARVAINPMMRAAFTGKGPINEAIRLCLEADDKAADWDSSFIKMKTVLPILETAEYKFTGALFCERLADLLPSHNQPKLASRFLSHAHQLAEGLGNDTLVKRLEAKEDERSRLIYEKSALLETIDGISNIIENLDNYPNALENIVRFAVRATEAERGVFLTRESRKAPLEVRAYVNIDPAALRGVQDFSRSVAREALNRGEVFMVGDAIKDDRTRRIKSIYVYNVRAVICVPIVSDEHVDAVLYLDHHTIPALFDEDDVRFVQALSRFLSVVLRTARDQKSAEAHRLYLERRLAKDGETDEFLTVDPKVKQDILDRLPLIAESGANVLLLGEPGTGKEILSKMIHDLSGRRDLVVLDCTSLADSLAESQLFGIVGGMATGVGERMGKFEVADGGTLFLDEIGELPIKFQAKVLRAVGLREIERVGGHKTIKVDVRFVLATNKNLRDMVAKGQFRQDLFDRISVIELEIPPLRERIADIGLIANHFARLPARKKKPTITLSERALTYLEAYSWPGNVRELKHVIDGLNVFYPGQKIGIKQLPKKIVAAFKQSEASGVRSDHAEKHRMQAVLERCGWNVTKAAKEYGMPVTTFRRKMKKYGIKPR